MKGIRWMVGLQLLAGLLTLVDQTAAMAVLAVALVAGVAMA